MAKSPPKRLKSQYNQINIIQRHVKVKRPKNLQQQSYHKREAMKANAIMEQLENRTEMCTAGETTSITLHHSMNQTRMKALSTVQNLRTP